MGILSHLRCKVLESFSGDSKQLCSARYQIKSPPVPIAGTNLSGGSGRGGGGGARPVLQGEVGNEDYELGKRAADLGARALEQVLREAVWVSKQDFVCEPIAYILTVSQQDAEGVIPRREGHRRCSSGGGPGREKTPRYTEEAGSPVAGRTPDYFLSVKTCAEEEPSSQLSTYHSNLLCLWQKMVLS